ncbi:alpha-galactosidase [Wenyingzhuangia heitensis]|uniref:Alpha-galactosidase n=1 Tax=Wenyingzhuangia heitensis TaxID=1487859 RepID=A0ABX0UCG2_9FLAO|nr:putative Ig domain-containing protein [Wenyingzhuangia heitensis]NIJ44836.1 alpha-galactosidase [Wenyingzhuangia heitensis]
MYCELKINKTFLIGCMLGFAILFSSCTTQKTYSPKVASGKYILTPKEKEEPQINGAAVFGVTPNAPFLYTIPATGVRPMEFSVKNLPNGLQVNQETGVISGQILDKKIGDHKVVLIAKNKVGVDQKEFNIKVGNTICLTPPLGWNSWNCWGPLVTQKNVIESAEAMVAKGLNNYGWSYINIDDAWQSKRGGKHHAILADETKFPDMEGLSNQVHNMGLKLGIYSSPWVTTYAGYIGGTSDFEDGHWDQSMNDKNNRKKGEKRTFTRVANYTFDENDAKQWADWGIDYLKYDWNPNEPASTIRMANALKNSGRDIIYSLSNTAPLENAALFGEVVNCFRTYGDLKDRWDGKGSHKSIRDEWIAHREWMEKGFSGAPGHFPDPDMLVVGDVNTKGGLHPSRLTADEQYAHVSLWSLWAAPMLIGCPIETMDDFTLNLLTNAEVLAINQDEIAIPGKTIYHDATMEIVVKELVDGSKALGLFNLKKESQTITVTWEDLGIKGSKELRDLWRQKDIGKYKETFSATVPSHGVVLVKIKK